ncbi:hypothetical protein [Neorhizobium sp. JUb45]|uniref:hypothetical protein n=1 Tax=unclassified Neorhizobium TaxID=2629175 RepID=UPI00105363CF|nr:hypothetical protein [Neorhizobium sp. JUb45]TCR04893.1 hypothetical protein EDF70_1021009 [Neorhizobium sp. JUb45]
MHAERSVSSSVVIERALAAVEKSKERRERWEREKKSRFERIQIANTRQPVAALKPGRQLSLRLDG